MNQTCKNCSAHFEITDQDQLFLKKISPTFREKTYSIPMPDMCPTCREQRRMAHRNERSFYHRKCDKTGKQIISLYSPEESYIVYDQEVWWSDQFDPHAYARDFDFNRPFFEQFAELEKAVPKLAIINAKSENCTYTNYSAENKNYYLVVGGLGAEDCYYSYRIFYSRDICDSYDLYKCERCYECLESGDLYNSMWSSNCFQSSNLVLCSDCTGCHDCFGCINLRNKKYHIYNQEFSKADYEKKVQELMGKIDTIRPDIEKLSLHLPHKFAQQIQCENVSGDELWNCKQCHNCYTLKNGQDCTYVRIGENNIDCMDCNFFDNCEMQYYSCNNEKNYNILFSSLVWYSKNVLYCMNCFNSENLFGCTGIKKGQYCILNKQYSKEEYEKRVAQIIEHMINTNEWGQFFPVHMSAFGYNETVAHDYVPLSVEQVQEKGWKWRKDDMQNQQYLGPKTEVNTNNTNEEIYQKILQCKQTGKPYKIIPQELTLYRSMGVPLPEYCPQIRHTLRMNRLRPRTLFARTCAKCSKNIQTTYSPDRPEIVYCEECYLSSVY